MQLDIHSDFVCPWCYLGHKRLAAAIDRMGPDADPIQLRWRSFLLDPRATTEPGDLREAVERKYGPGTFAAMSERLGELGRAMGIEYRFDLAQRVSTFDAHRLLQWTQSTAPARTELLAEGLFRAYFTEGANVADPDVLVGLAADIGIESDAAAELLAGDGYSEVVRRDASEALASGVTGVPAVAFGGAVVIPGAQDVDTMEAVLRRLLKKFA